MWNAYIKSFSRCVVTLEGIFIRPYGSYNTKYLNFGISRATQNSVELDSRWSYSG